MGDDLSSLGEGDLSRLVQVIETVEHSAFDFLELEIGGMKVVLGKGDPAGYARRPRAESADATTGVDALRAGSVGGSETAGPQHAFPEQAQDEAQDEANEGTVEIRAPMVGMFYAQPQPGASPYVDVGSVVQRDTTVALLEVMKMFNAVPAGVEGTVVAVLVEDNQLVEYGQPLFRVRSHDGAGSP